MEAYLRFIVITTILALTLAAPSRRRSPPPRRRPPPPRRLPPPPPPPPRRLPPPPPSPPPPRRLPPPPPPPPPMPLPNDIVGFYFVQEWPAAYCDIQNHRSAREQKQCNKELLVPNNFTVHGLWPYTITGTILAEKELTCVQIPYYGRKFDRRLVRSVTDLERVWPNFLKSQTPKDLWEYQYNQHGACTNPYRQFGRQHRVIDQVEYFDDVILLKNQINIYQVLADEGITPNDGQYTVEKIKYALMRRLRLTPMLICENNGTHTLLLEVMLCVDASGKNFIRCTYESQGCGNYKAMVTFKALSSVA